MPLAQERIRVKCSGYFAFGTVKTRRPRRESSVRHGLKSTSARFAGANPHGLGQIADKDFPIADLVTHRYPLAEADLAFREFAAGRTGKVLLMM